MMTYSPKSYTGKSSALFALVALTFFVSIAMEATAAITLGQLDQCDDMLRISASLRAGSAAGKCRAASSELERSLLAATKLTNAQICWTQSPPVPSLRGFSCARPVVPSGATLVCVRPTEASEISSYKVNVASFKQPVANYLERAKQCSLFSRGTSAGSRGSIPKLLTYIGKFEFSFVAAFGDGAQPDGMATHGFASTDPALSGVAPNAFEYVEVFTGGAYEAGGPGQQVGNWLVRYDDLTKVNSEFAKLLRSSNIPVRAKLIDWKVSRSQHSYSSDKKRQVLEKLHDAFVASLEFERFETVPDDELKSVAGNGSEAMLSAIKKSLPYGTRDTVNLGTSKLSMLAYKGRQSCARDDRGSFGVMLLKLPGIDGVKSDFGGFTFGVIAMGECGRVSNSAANQFFNGLLQDAQEVLKTTLQQTD